MSNLIRGPRSIDWKELRNNWASYRVLTYHWLIPIFYTSSIRHFSHEMIEEFFISSWFLVAFWDLDSSLTRSTKLCSQWDLRLNWTTNCVQVRCVFRCMNWQFEDSWYLLEWARLLCILCVSTTLLLRPISNSCSRIRDARKECPILGEECTRALARFSILTY